jgi:hypothetical protein
VAAGWRDRACVHRGERADVSCALLICLVSATPPTRFRGQAQRNHASGLQAGRAGIADVVVEAAVRHQLVSAVRQARQRVGLQAIGDALTPESHREWWSLRIDKGDLARRTLVYRLAGGPWLGCLDVALVEVDVVLQLVRDYWMARLGRDGSCPPPPREGLSPSEFQHVPGPIEACATAVANRAIGVDLVATKPAVYPPRK